MEETKEQGLDMEVATKILLTSGPISVIEYMISTIFSIWGITLKNNGAKTFTDFFLDYMTRKTGETNKESLAASLIMLSLGNLDLFIDYMRMGIIDGGMKLLGDSVEDRDTFISKLPYAIKGGD